MTETRPGGAALARVRPGASPGTEDAPREVYSKDYWDIVLSQIQRRKLSVFALFVLIFLYATAIFAPFLANDRPLYFEGVDVGGYGKAQREIGLVTDAFLGHVQEGRAHYEESLAEGSNALPWNDILDREFAAIESRLAVLARQLGEADRKPVDELRSLTRDLLEKGRDSEPIPPDAGQGARRLVRTIQEEMNPVVRRSEAVPGRSVVLQPFRSWPVIENLSRGEIFFMVLAAVTLLFPIWNRIVNARLGHDRLRMRRARRGKLAAFLLLPLLAAVLWQGQSASFFVSPYKSGLSDGTVFAKKVVFAPVPYGIAETNGDETFRPPTWHPTSRIDDQGYFVEGPWAGRIDPTTRLPRVPKQVAIEFGEPERNDAFRHFLGTDSLGRDLLARIIWGGRVSLAVGLVATAILVFIGVIVGSFAGYFGGWVDIVLSRLIEVVQTFPAFFLILIMVAFVGPSILNIMVIIGLVGWTGVARLVRGEFIRLRGQEFVIASEALGVGVGRTIFRHILPNALGPVLVAATFGVASGILTESALSFLGLGIQLPIPSWGSLLIESRSAQHWWIQIYPGLLIFVTVFLYNLFGEGVRDALDPRLKVTH